MNQQQGCKSSHQDLSKLFFLATKLTSSSQLWTDQSRSSRTRTHKIHQFCCLDSKFSFRHFFKQLWGIQKNSTFPSSNETIISPKFVRDIGFQSHPHTNHVRFKIAHNRQTHCNKQIHKEKNSERFKNLGLERN